jgi:protein tyrosine/serine phosphatase
MTIVFLTLIGSLGLSCGVYAAYLQLSGNFHPVIDGQLYRSAQPTAEQLVSYVRANGIKTVINLRGYHPGVEWYDQEVATTKDLGIKHIDFGMSASKMISPQKAAEIVSLMASAPKPILIHCQSGADRSGLVAALYVRKVAGLDDYRAQGQLSFYYGHVGIPIASSAYAMDRSWQEIEASDWKQAGAISESTVVLK